MTTFLPKNFFLCAYKLMLYLKVFYLTVTMQLGPTSANDGASLYFFQPDTTMNDPKYLGLLKHKLDVYMVLHDFNTFMHDGASCYRTSLVKNC